MRFIKSVAWFVAGMFGYILMIVSGVGLLSAFLFSKADLTLQNISILILCAGLFLFGFYLNYKNQRR
ncbi:hypothetical protein CO671_18875 [Rhizobium sp. M10]|uniref:hypothetical protein n=1 Tax=Rhizobium sp. M10 TaxID=1324586 RepID=UPI000BEA26E1|nr:hypothetical protein [Rhizobium sp. M10]PDT34775.1 hypothetical protein CO671_18875 [Rhizobium sp. M10]